MCFSLKCATHVLQSKWYTNKSLMFGMCGESCCFRFLLVNIHLLRIRIHIYRGEILWLCLGQHRIAVRCLSLLYRQCLQPMQSLLGLWPSFQPFYLFQHFRTHSSSSPHDTVPSLLVVLCHRRVWHCDLWRLCDKGGCPVLSEIQIGCLRTRSDTVSSCQIAWFSPVSPAHIEERLH